MEVQQLFERLFKRNPAPMALTALPDRRLADVNDAFLKTLGYARSEMIGKTTADLGLFPDAEQHGASAEELLATGRIDDHELQVRCRDGSLRDGLFSGEVISSQGRQFVLTVMIDITERKRMGQALREQSDLLARVIEGTNAGTWQWNVQTGAAVFNERWAGISGHTLAELAPTSIRTWIDLAHPDDLKASDAMLQKHFAGVLDYYDFECRMRHKNGSWVWVHDRGKVTEWTADGKPLVMTGTHTDITERKRNEEELHRHRLHLEEMILERTADLAAANEKLRREMNERQQTEMALQIHRSQLAHVARLSVAGELTSGLAHEISQPLGAIGNYASSAIQRLQGNTHVEKQVVGAIEKIAVQARRAGEVIAHVRRFASRQTPQRSPADLNGLVRSAVSLAEHDLSRSSAPVGLDLAEGLPCVSVDSIQIEQVIINLLRNAVEAMSAGSSPAGSVRIGTSLGPGGRVEVRVTDQGPGIDPEIAPRLFQPFATNKPGGMGVGLSISRTIIETHGGRIRTESNPRGGAVFIFDLPVDGGDACESA